MNSKELSDPKETDNINYTIVNNSEVGGDILRPLKHQL